MVDKSGSVTVLLVFVFFGQLPVRYMQSNQIHRFYFVYIINLMCCTYLHFPMETSPSNCRDLLVQCSLFVYCRAGYLWPDENPFFLKQGVIRLEDETRLLIHESVTRSCRCVSTLFFLIYFCRRDVLSLEGIALGQVFSRFRLGFGIVLMINK